MLKNCCFAVLLALSPALAGAQASHTDSLWIEAGNLRICLRADGSLYSGAPGGAVLYRHLTPQGEEKWVKVVQDAGLWFGGTDPGGSLALSVQTFEPRATDFRAGFAGVPGSGKIWSVTYDQIAQHVADYSDNGYIDHPIEAVFAWPGFGNRFFEQYNGFELPEGNNTYGSFNDLNSNYVYEPDKGEYPNYVNSGADLLLIMPEQLHFFAFHTDKTSSIFSNPWNHSIPFQVTGHVFNFNCDKFSIFENCFFTTLEWKHIGYERIDQSLVGLYVNADIGNPEDDYHGCLPDAYFAYNATDLDSTLGIKPPMLMVSSITSPLDHFGIPSCARMIPVWSSNATGVPGAMKFPKLPMEFYNFLNARWANGKPISVGGNGYNSSTTDYTTQAFLGNPYTPGGWTDINAQNPPGDRRGLLSWDYQQFLPNQHNQFMYTTVVHPQDTTQTSQAWFDSLVAGIQAIRLGFVLHDYEFMAPSCQENPNFSFPHILARPYPNPASDVLNIQIEGGEPEFVRLYDAYGRMVAETRHSCKQQHCLWENPVVLPVHHLPTGLYYLEVTAFVSGQKAVRKVIIAP